MLTTATRKANRMKVGLRESRRQRFSQDIGTISLEGTPIDEKPDAIGIEFVENRSPPVTPTPGVRERPAHEHLPTGIQETEEVKREELFVGSIDQGTTSSRFLIFNTEGEPVANYQIEFDNHYPESG